MEAVMSRSSPDKRIYPYKTTHRRGAANGIINRHPSISSRVLPSENFVPPLNLYNNNNTGLLQAPPQLLPVPTYSPFHSYPPFSMHQQKPPLLPLPISSNTKPINSSIKPPAGIIRGLSLPPTTSRKPHNKTNNIRSRDSSLTPKKSKTMNPSKEESLKPLGPDPKDLPKHVPKTLTLLSGSTNACNIRSHDQPVDEFSGSVVFTISPPPSSLPLPTFSLRPKLSCNAEAGGIDAGATDNLCRLLRLR